MNTCIQEKESRKNKKVGHDERQGEAVIEVNNRPGKCPNREHCSLMVCSLWKLYKSHLRQQELQKAKKRCRGQGKPFLKRQADGKEKR